MNTFVEPRFEHTMSQISKSTADMQVSFTFVENREVLYTATIRELVQSANRYVAMRAWQLATRWESGVDVVSVPLQKYKAYLEVV